MSITEEVEVDSLCTTGGGGGGYHHMYKKVEKTHKEHYGIQNTEYEQNSCT